MNINKTFVALGFLAGILAFSPALKAQTTSDKNTDSNNPRPPGTDLSSDRDIDNANRSNPVLTQQNCTLQPNQMAICSQENLDQTTELTFSQAVRLPGNKVLPPGTYFFALNNQDVNSNTVRILNDRKKLITTLITVPVERPKATQGTVMVFAPGSSRDPHTLTLLKWFYHDHLNGHQFVYPGREGKALEEQTPVTVMAQTGRTPKKSSTKSSSLRY